MPATEDRTNLLAREQPDGDSHEMNGYSDQNGSHSDAAAWTRHRPTHSRQLDQQRRVSRYCPDISILLHPTPQNLRKVMIGAAITLLVILILTMLPTAQPPVIINLVGSSTPSSVETNTTIYQKPGGVPIKGVIFYGRARFVDILDCYLQKNLAVNGGMMDEVLFMQNTDNPSDLAYLDQLVAKVPQYRKVAVDTVGGKHAWGGFDTIWKGLTDAGTIYVKIDDDLVWIHDDAIPRMVATLIAHPEAHDIAGNIVNSPLTNWLHFHSGAIHPFLPEQSPPKDGPSEPTNWRTSTLPSFSGMAPDAGYDWEPQRSKHDWEAFGVGQVGGPPFTGHRWLPLPANSEQLLKTPIAAASYDPWGFGWTSWAMAAQQHYSLLRNIENGWLSRYWFGNAEGIWNLQYGRYNLNFLAIWGSSVALQLPGEDDEGDLTVHIPLKFKRPCLVDTHALVAHFNFKTQPEIGHTDLLDRYRLYANEHVCAPGNQKSRLAKST